MARFSYWIEECSYEICNEKIDTYKSNDYIEMGGEVWCKECFEYEYGAAFESHNDEDEINTEAWGMRGNKNG